MIGDNIKRYRKRAGLTQKQLAEKSGLAEITIRQYESNKREPKSGYLDDIAGALDIPTILLLSSSNEAHDAEDQMIYNNHQAFISYLESLGYKVIDNTLLYGEEYDPEIEIYSSDANTDVPLSSEEFEDLMDFSESQIDLELSRMLKKKSK